LNTPPENRRAHAAGLRNSRAVAVSIGLAVFAAHCHGNMGCSDSAWSIPTAVSLIDQGNADLDEFQPLLAARGTSSIERHRNHSYTRFPIGPSVVAIPGVLVLRPVASVLLSAFPSLNAALEARQRERGCRPEPGEPVVRLSSYTELVIASAIVAATTSLLYLIAALELPPWPAALVAFVFAFGTSAWSTASRALWQHGPSMLMLTLSLFVLRRRNRPAWAGLALGFSYVIRPTNAIPLAINSALVAWKYRARAAAYVAGVSVVLLLFLLFNWSAYRLWLPPYYQAGRVGLSTGTFAEALAGNLVSPGRGLFVFSPVLAFAIGGIVLKLRRGSFEALDTALVATIVLHWMVISSFPHWWAGFSYGPRFFSDMLPYLIYFLIPVVAWMTTTSGVGRTIVASAFAAALAVSVLMHAQGALNRATMFWNVVPVSVDDRPERIWDWRRPQFLAGFE
jgi:hypothetical protein